MSTVKELEAKKLQLENERKIAYDALLNDPEYRLAQEIFSEASKKYETDKNRIEAPYLEIILTIERQQWENRNALLDAIEQEKKNKLSEYSDEIHKIVSMITSGVDCGSGGLFPVWASADQRFFILKNPGHTYWANVCETHKYTPTNHILIDTVKFYGDRQKYGFMSISCGTVMEREGRLTKTAMKEFEARIEQIRKESV
jgi:hypothetical protein